MLSKKEFISNLLEEIQKKIPEGMNVQKINATRTNYGMDAFAVSMDDKKVGIVVYPEDYYAEYQKGNSPDAVAEQILSRVMKEDFEKLEALGEKVTDEIMEYESVKYDIFPVLIGYEHNINILREIPHETFLDMILVASYFNGDTQIKINKNLMDSWGIDKEELFSQARFNAKMFKPNAAIPLTSLIGNNENLDIKADNIPMYVVTNSEKSYGAYGIMDVDLLKELGDKIGDFYIFPSSIHEIITMPVDKAPGGPKELEKMVKEINQYHVAPWEILSNHVYTFREGKVRIFEAGKELTHEQYQKEQNKTKSGPQLS